MNINCCFIDEIKIVLSSFIDFLN